MLYTRLTQCAECTTISALLTDIDYKLVEMAKKLYNNITLMLGWYTSPTVMMDLLNYRRILTYKLSNEEYAPDFSIEDIASRIKLLKYK